MPTRCLLDPLVPDQAARVVVTWLNKAKEAEEKRARAVAEPLALDGGGDNNDEISEEDDDDQDEFVYDMQVCNSLCSCCCSHSSSGIMTFTTQCLPRVFWSNSKVIFRGH